MMVMKDEVADDWCGDETRKCENIGDRIDVLVGRKLGEDFEKRLLGLWSRRSGASLSDSFILTCLHWKGVPSRGLQNEKAVLWKDLGDAKYPVRPIVWGVVKTRQ